MTGAKASRRLRFFVIVAGLVLVASGCTINFNQQQGSNSPETSPSLPAVIASPSTEPTSSASPSESPTGSSPSPKPSPSPSRLIITALAFHMGEVGFTYATVTAGASGGVKPYKWSISSGALPGGLALSSGGSTTGKPTTIGTFSFVIRVDDSAGAAAGVSRSIFVFRQIYFTKPRAACSGTDNTGCTTTLSYLGGASGATPKLLVSLRSGDPPLPTGSTVTAKSGAVTVTIPPKCNASYNAVMTLVLVDPSPCTVGYACSSAPGTVDITIVITC